MAKITRLEDARRTRDAAIAGGPTEHTEALVARTRRYRLRAEELRVIAGDVKLAETRLTLFSLAESYERMALMLEGLAADSVMA